MPPYLIDKVVLVTGAAHRLGREIALRLADEGCQVVVHYHQAEASAAATVDDIRRRGLEAIPVSADLRSLSGIDSLFATIDRSVGSLDYLVTSAAVLEPVDLLGASEADWQRTIDLNLKGAFFCLQRAAERMQDNGGAIVNISDVAGLRPWKRYPVHSISKAGVEMLTRVAALALAPRVRVNAVAPGLAMKPETMTEERWLALADSVPLRKAGSPADIADAVIFLFKHEYITGETLVVDGGYRLV